MNKTQMIKKLFTNIFFFSIVFIILSVAAGFYYYDRVAQKTPADKGQISYSDFRVFWFASYHLRHHILEVFDPSTGRSTFRPFWFLDPRLRNKAEKTARPGDYLVYDKNEKFYHFRYSPFVAFIMLPLGRIAFPADALIIWYALLNLLFLLSLLLLTRQLKIDFNLSDMESYIILWSIFIAFLRFYLINISLGQTDIITLFIFVLFLISYTKNRDILCGILFALILQFKPFFAPMLVYFLFTRKITIILSTVISFIFFLIVPSYLIGLKAALGLSRDWLEVLKMSIPSQILNVKNQSLVYAIGSQIFKIESIKRLFGSATNLLSLISVIFTLFSCAAIASLKKSSIRHDDKKIKYMEISLLIIMSLLFTPLAWEAHFISLLIPAGVAICLVFNSKNKKAPFYALGAFFILSCIAGTDITKFIFFINKLHFNITLGTLFLAFALIYLEFDSSAGS